MEWSQARIPDTLSVGNPDGWVTPDDWVTLDG
jgi:hypothetical protein